MSDSICKMRIETRIILIIWCMVGIIMIPFDLIITTQICLIGFILLLIPELRYAIREEKERNEYNYPSRHTGYKTRH